MLAFRHPLQLTKSQKNPYNLPRQSLIIELMHHRKIENTLTVKQTNKVVFSFSVPILPKLRRYDNVGRRITKRQI